MNGIKSFMAVVVGVWIKKEIGYKGRVLIYAQVHHHPLQHTYLRPILLVKTHMHSNCVGKATSGSTCEMKLCMFRMLVQVHVISPFHMISLMRWGVGFPYGTSTLMKFRPHSPIKKSPIPHFPIPCWPCLLPSSITLTKMIFKAYAEELFTVPVVSWLLVFVFYRIQEFFFVAWQCLCLESQCEKGGITMVLKRNLYQVFEFCIRKDRCWSRYPELLHNLKASRLMHKPSIKLIAYTCLLSKLS